MIPVADMTAVELAGYVGSHFDKRGINVVLSGGTCVAYYSKGKYVSMDLDFVNAGLTRRGKIAAAMAELGFLEENRYFQHPDTKYLVEFPRGPLAIGDEPVGEIVEIKTRAGAFRIISSTECVKDRLAGFYHWSDLQCLEQALMVARQNPVDLREIKRWSAKEGKGILFQQFKKKISATTEPMRSR